jgi:hypothetical protein
MLAGVSRRCPPRNAYVKRRVPKFKRRLKLSLLMGRPARFVKFRTPGTVLEIPMAQTGQRTASAAPAFASPGPWRAYKG